MIDTVTANGQANDFKGRVTVVRDAAATVENASPMP
jgi:hypothetical protein